MAKKKVAKKETPQIPTLAELKKSIEELADLPANRRMQIGVRDRGVELVVYAVDPSNPVARFFAASPTRNAHYELMDPIFRDIATIDGTGPLKTFMEMCG